MARSLRNLLVQPVAVVPLGGGEAWDALAACDVALTDCGEVRLGGGGRGSDGWVVDVVSAPPVGRTPQQPTL